MDKAFSGKADSPLKKQNQIALFFVQRRPAVGLDSEPMKIGHSELMSIIHSDLMSIGRSEVEPDF